MHTFMFLLVLLALVTVEMLALLILLDVCSEFDMETNSWRYNINKYNRKDVIIGIGVNIFILNCIVMFCIYA